jgi:hypothetical protein
MAAAIELAACLRYTGTEPLAGEMGRFGAIRPAIVTRQRRSRNALSIRDLLDAFDL